MTQKIPQKLPYIFDGVSLDPIKSIRDDIQWHLFFNGGSFTTPWSVYSIEDFIIPLDINEYKDCSGITPCLYSVYYNPKTSNYSIELASNKERCIGGYLIGGFQVKGCEFIFVEPNPCDDIEYLRGFSDLFDSSVTKTLECGTCFGDYNIEAFSDAFNKECVLISNPDINGGAFEYRSFTDGYDIK